MENQPKLNNSKEVIAYLAKRFPHCFIAEGEARPLKIGIFQDLVECLQTYNDHGISKTQLRTALRLYTSSWRYLHGVKNNTQRVDLEGNPSGELTAEHIEHACQRLQAAKKRAQAQNAARQVLKEGERRPEKRRTTAVNGKKELSKNRNQTEKQIRACTVMQSAKMPDERVVQKTASANVATKAAPANHLEHNLKRKPADLSKLQVGQDIQVKAGRSTVGATILEIAKDGVHVQLSSGLAMIVRAEHLQY